ncbi:MAG: histidine--tRNA ligase [Actinomycetota bacterium]
MSDDAAALELLRAPVGTHDLLPGDSDRWIALLGLFAHHAHLYGYGLIQTPLFEDVRLFKRGVGTETEVVGKEMYEFEDRGGRAMALRPEGTASVVRAFLQAHPTPPFRAWYAAPIFRYERPQAGRYRQHHQVGIEVLGISDPDVDVEVLSLALDYLTGLGLEGFTLRLNTLGDGACRPQYLENLKAYLHAHEEELCDEHAKKIDRNPLRILDCKTEACRSVSVEAPSMLHALCDDCDVHFKRVTEGLEARGISFLLDQRLVRGLDYYTRTAFEVTLDLGDGELTLLGGGRYDGLVEVLGGPPTPGIGFGSGIERVLLACDRQGVFTVSPSAPLVYVVDTTDGRAARDLVAELRAGDIGTERAYGNRSMKSQFKTADRSGARFAIVIGERELEAGTVTIRDLRGGGEQLVVLRSEVLNYLSTRSITTLEGSS